VLEDQMTDTRDRTVDDLIDQPASVFPSDLTGYAAGAAALELMGHWDTADPPLTTTEQLSDIDLTIAVLTRWRAQVHAQGTHGAG
jgi:hypothetical protein